jgi:hypothetical protein
MACLHNIGLERIHVAALLAPRLKYRHHGLDQVVTVVAFSTKGKRSPNDRLVQRGWDVVGRLNSVVMQESPQPPAMFIKLWARTAHSSVPGA